MDRGFALVMGQAEGLISQPTIFEALMKVDSNSQGVWGFVQIQLSTTMGDGSWWTSCVLGRDIGRRQPSFQCAVSQWMEGARKSEYATNPPVDIAFDRWYRIQIEVEPQTMRLHFSLDGKEIDQYLPRDSDTLSGSTFTPEVSIWMRKGTSVVAFVDDVRYGPSE